MATTARCRRCLIPTVNSLSQADYISLETYRRNGAAIPTPVWFASKAGVDRQYYVFSAGNAWKVKRLANNSSVRVARCDVRGKVLDAWLEGEGSVITDPGEVARALVDLRAKYGWQMKLLDFFAKLSGRFEHRAYILISLDPEVDQ